MTDPTRLRTLLSDHPPQAYFDKDQAKIRDVWDAAREMLAEIERLEDLVSDLREDIQMRHT